MAADAAALAEKHERDLLAFEEVVDGEFVQPTKYNHVPGTSSMPWTYTLSNQLTAQ